MTRVLLCDLDDTLTDGQSGFTAWADAFAHQHDLHPQQRRLLDDLDHRQRQREAFFTALVRELPLPADPQQLWADYRRQMPALTPAVEGVHEALHRLREQGWLLALVSNGREDNQRGKLRTTGLGACLDAVVISEGAGVRKPDPAIFQQALDQLDAQRADVEESWVIGDDPDNDIRGGNAFGAHTCWVSHGRTWPLHDVIPTRTAATVVHGLRDLADTTAH